MLPTVEVEIGESLVDVLVRIGFAKSKREARYFITHGAVKLARVSALPPKQSTVTGNRGSIPTPATNQEV